MQETMKAFSVDADWAPRPGHVLSPREAEEKRALRADLVYRNIRAGLRELPIPKVGPEDVLVSIGACGVCGSDLSALKMGEDGYSAYTGHLRLPVITGHEYSGEVVEVGRDVRTVRPGDLVAVEQIRWCGRCRVCRTGSFNGCENLEEAGLSCDGGFAEYALVPEKYCCLINDVAERLGDRMAALEAGALAEPTCVAYAGMQINAGGIKPGCDVAVFGAGPIGLAAIALARAAGAATIVAFNTNPARDRLALTMGADEVLDPKALSRSGGGAGEAMLERTRGRGAGMIVEASGNFPAVYPEIMRCLAIGARVVQLGLGSGPAAFDAGLLIRKCAHIVGSLGHAGSDIFPSVLRMMAAGALDMRPMITGRFALDDAAAGIGETGERERGHGKVLISHRYG